MGSLWLLTIFFCVIQQNNAANATNAAPVLQTGAIDYAIINQFLPAGTNLLNLLVTDPENGTLTFSIIKVTYFHNDTAVPVHVSNPPTEVFGKLNSSSPSHCLLAEIYPFPRNLFCMEPTNNSIKTTSRYSNTKKADFSLFAVTVLVTDNGSPQKNLTTVIYFRIRENCSDSTREYTNLITGCTEAREIIRRTGSPSEVGFIFNVPNNTKIARLTLDFGLFNPFKVIGDIVNYRFEYYSGAQRTSVVLRRRLLVNTALDRKIAMFLWNPIDVIGDRVNVSVTVNVESGRNRLFGGGQGIELFLLSRSRNYCENSICVGLYGALTKSMAANGGKPECTRQDQYVVVEKYSKCVAATPNAAPVLQAGTSDYVIINKTLPAGTALHNLLVTDPEKGKLTFSIFAVGYFKNDTEKPVIAKNSSWTLFRKPNSSIPSQCSLAESYPFPRNLFCMEPTSNVIKTTSKYRDAIKADFSLFAVAVAVIDNGSPQKNLTTGVYFRIRENCSDSTREYTNLVTRCTEAKEIIRRTGMQSQVGFTFNVPNNTKIVRITVNFALFNPFKVVTNVVNYRFNYTSDGKSKSEIVKRRLLVNTTLERKIAIFLWKPIDIVGDTDNVSVTLKVDSGTNKLVGGGQGIELFLLNRSRNYCKNSECVGLYHTLSKSISANGGKPECTRQDQFAVVEKYGACSAAQNAAPVLQAGANDYAIINKSIPALTNLHKLLVTDPDNGKLTFSISEVKYFKNGTDTPVSASDPSWALTGTPKSSRPTQCSLAESYPFPRNLFCIEPTSNSIRTTSKYMGATKADFSLFAVTVFVIDNGSPQKNLTTVVYFRIRENCSDFTREYTNLMTGCTEAREIIRRTGTVSEIGFIFNVPNNTKIVRMAVDFGLLNPFKVIGDLVNYRFAYTSGGKRISKVLKRRLLVDTKLDRKIAMFLWRPIDIIGDRVNVSVTLNVDSGKSRLFGRGQGIELFLLNRSRNYCKNSRCVGLYGTLTKSMAAGGGKPECTRQDQYVVVEKYSKCIVNQPPTLSIRNIQLETAPIEGQIIGRIVATDMEKTKITYGIQWIHSKMLERNVTESAGFAGRECAEAAKVAAPLNYICVDPNSGEVKATSGFKYMLRETLTVKVYAIDSGNPRQYSTHVFQISTYDPCKRAKTNYNRLSTSCMGTKNQYVTARKAESALLFSRSGDRVVRIGINRNIVRFPLDIDFTIFTLKQVLSPLNPRKYGRQVRAEYNNTAQDLHNKSDVQLPLVLSFDGAFEVELSAVSYSTASTAVFSPTLDSSGIRLYVHSFKATCGSTECVSVYRSWLDEARKSGLDSCKADPLLVHQYYKICLNPPAFKVHPQNISVSMNSIIVVNCTYQNFTAVTFQWIKDGTIFTPSIVPDKNAYREDSVVSQQNQQGRIVKSFAILGVEPGMQGYYHCMVKDAFNHTVNSTKSLVRFKDVSTSRMVLNINQPFSNALRNRSSPQYKKLSTDVTNALQNMLDRNNMHKQRKVVIREFRPGSVIASADIYYINVTEQNRRSLCSQFRHISPSVTGTGLQISSVKTVSYDCCYKEQTGEKNIKGVITWNSILADSFDRQTCPYGFYDYDFNTTVFYKASRFCQPNFQDGAQWQAPNMSDCAYRTLTTFKLEKMSETNITYDNVELIAGELDSLTSSEDVITNRLDVKFTVDTIERLVNSNKKLSKIAKDIINTTSNMMDFNYTYVTESQVQYNSSSKVLTSLDNLALQLELLPNATIKTTSKNLALAIKPVTSVDKGIAISAKRDQSSGYNRIDIEDTLSSEVSLRDTAQILLPELMLRRAAQLDPNSFNRIYSFVFESDRLFLTKKQLEKTLNSSSGQTTASLSEKITSRILSASIGKIKLKNLTENEEMRGRFRILSKDPGEVKCVYWKFNIEDRFGAWWSNGCRPVGMTNSIQKCRCNHLTNFAILLDVTGKGTPPEAATALSIITYIGCAISLLFLLITLITFAVFKNLREKRPPRILMNLSVALILTIIVFLAGIRAKDLKGCQAVAVLIHYFVLASFMWMAVEGFNLYLSFVKVMNTGISRFMLKSSIFAWGTPVIIVTISAAATKLESYGKKNGSDEFLCMVTGTAFYVAYLVPILLIVTTNLVIMAFVIKSLRKSSQVSKDRRMTGLTMARIGAACSVLMGTTWIIGLFAVDVLTIPMQVLFCILNSLQGFFIFIFYCARNKDAKKQWMDTLGSRSADESKSSSMGFHRYKAGKGSPGANKGLMVSTNFYELEPQNKPSPRSSISIHDSTAEDNIVSLKDVQHHTSANGVEVKKETPDSSFRDGNDSVHFVSGPEEVDVIVKLGKHDTSQNPDGGVM